VKLKVMSVNKLTSQKSGKEYCKVLGDDGIIYITYDMEFANLQGQTVDVVTSKRGDSTWIDLEGKAKPAFGGSGGGFKGRSPLEIKCTARTMCMSYAKDEAIAFLTHFPKSFESGTQFVEFTLTTYRKMVEEVEKGL